MPAVNCSMRRLPPRCVPSSELPLAGFLESTSVHWSSHALSDWPQSTSESIPALRWSLGPKPSETSTTEPRHECSSCLGDAYIVPAHLATGTVTAQIDLDGFEEYPQSILAQSTSGKLYTHLAIDTTGKVEGELPVGTYELSVPNRLIEIENEEGDASDRREGLSCK